MCVFSTIRAECRVKASSYTQSVFGCPVHVYMLHSTTLHVYVMSPFHLEFISAAFGFVGVSEFLCVCVCERSVSLAFASNLTL